MKTKKKFDCVRMKREGALRLRKHLHALSDEQRRAYWDEAFQRLVQVQQELRAAQQKETRSA